MSSNRLALAVIAAFAFDVSAQNLQCPDIARTLKEYSIDSSSSSFLNAVFSEHCQQDGSRKSSGGSAGLDLVIKAVPVKFSGSYNSSDEGFSNFCKAYKSQNEGAAASDSYKETISRKSLETISQCLALQATGVTITHQINNVEAANFYLKASVTSVLDLKGVSITGNVACEGIVGGRKKVFDASLDLPVKTTTAFACKRTGIPGPKRTTSFGEATVTVLSSQGNYAMFWPKDERQSPDMATEIDRRISQLQAELSVAKANIDPLITASSSAVYKCPNGSQGLGYDALWMYIGCNGQYSTESSCTNIWNGKPAQTLQCTPAGNLKLFK